MAILMAIPSAALFSMYHVYFNARFGGTVGKLAMGIRITKPNGTRIGWSQAWKRSSVDILFAVIMMYFQVWALTRVSESDYAAASWVEQAKMLQSFYPKEHFVFSRGQQIWVWSEVLIV
jgi:uncharacterized RDD family membrane protein YckC